MTGRFASIAVAALLSTANGHAQAPSTDAYLNWTAKQASEIGKTMRASGRVGGAFDLRVVHTERAYNYKLRATWLTPEAIRASARVVQLAERLSDEHVRALVVEAEAAGDTVVMVEIDPREGSGVIPNDWTALLQPKRPAEPPVAARGTFNPRLRAAKALSGVVRRDYDYDIFWVVFALVDEAAQPIFTQAGEEAELVVRIYNKEGRVSWRVPASVVQRAHAVAASRKSADTRKR